MQLSPRSALARAQAAVCVVTVTAALAVVPAFANTASAADRSSAASSECTSAHSATMKAQHKQAAAKKAVAKAKKALAKAKKAKAHKKSKVAKAKKALAKAKKAYAASGKAVKSRQSYERSACSAKTTPAKNTGKKISLLGLGDGIDPSSLNAAQLQALLGKLLPGVTDFLSADQLNDLLAGFNSGSSIDPSEALSLLSGVLSPDEITALLGGSASPEVLTDLITDIIGQLSSLGGDLPIPSDFDPTALWETFSGIFGNLGAGQLGSLLQLLTAAAGSSGGSFDAGQLTDLIDSLVPGISDQFDPSQLTAMLGGLNGSGLSAASLSNLLGGQFSPAQLLSVLGGTANQALLGSVISQVMAQLGTAGDGDLQLPGALGAGQVATLISTVTNLLSGITGGGGGVLPVVCGIVPIPLLCP